MLSELDVEPAIQEESEVMSSDETMLASTHLFHHGDSPWGHATGEPSGSFLPQYKPDVSRQIIDAIEPLRFQLQELRTELSQIDRRDTEIRELKAQMTSLMGFQEKHAHLETEVRELRSQAAALVSLQEEMKQLKRCMDEAEMQLPSTPVHNTPRIPVAQGVFPSAFKSTTYPPVADDTSPAPTPRRERSGSVLAHPGFAATTLGKRHRESLAGDLLVESEGGQAAGLAEEKSRSLANRGKKRQKLSEESSTFVSGMLPTDDSSPQHSAHRIASFATYSGVDDEYNSSFIDAPPPTQGLPEFFGTSSPSGPEAKSSMPPNPHQIFNFNFIPMSSTPAPNVDHQSFMAPFPFPDPPASPSPATHGLGYLGRIEEEEKRTDVFKSFGLPSPRRPRLSQTPPPGGSVDPLDLGSRSASKGKQRDVSSNDVAAGLGLHVVHTGSSTDASHLTTLPPAKRTMYGTEVEAETRFGDFGVPGSFARGFWAGR